MKPEEIETRSSPFDRLRAGARDAEEDLNLGEGAVPVETVIIYRRGRGGTQRQAKAGGKPFVNPVLK